MKSKKISIKEFIDYTNVTDDIFTRTYSNYTALSRAFHRFPNIEFILINSKSDDVINIYKEKLKAGIFPVILSGVDFTDAKVFEKLPGNLSNIKDLAVIIDAMVGNMAYFFAGSNKMIDSIREQLAFIMNIQRELLTKLYRKLYGSSEIEAIDDLTICIAYSLFNHILGYSSAEAKLHSIDLLYDTEILNQSKYSTRIGINVRFDDIIQSNSKSLYDVLYYAGYFTDFMNQRDFYTAIAKMYDPELVKYVFNTLTFNTAYNTRGYFIYKAIVLSSSDIIHELRGYTKIKGNINLSMRTAKNVINKELLKYAKFIDSNVKR